MPPRNKVILTTCFRRLSVSQAGNMPLKSCRKKAQNELGALDTVIKIFTRDYENFFNG